MHVWYIKYILRLLLQVSASFRPSSGSFTPKFKTHENKIHHKVICIVLRHLHIQTVHMLLWQMNASGKTHGTLSVQTFRLVCKVHSVASHTGPDGEKRYSSTLSWPSVVQTTHLMLYREIIAVCSQIHTKHINYTVWAERRTVEYQSCWCVN